MSEPLIARWLEDRDALTEDEAAELLRLLSSDPDLARRVKEQLVLDDALSRHQARDRADFPAQVAQRLRSAGNGEAFLESTLRQARRREPSSRTRWLFEAAAALMLVAALAFFLSRREPSAVVPAAAAGGFRGEYFAGRDFRGAPRIQVDSELDFRWPAGEGPLAGAGDIYCIRWSGRIRPLRSGIHTFRTRNDDGMRVRVGGTLVVDDWNARLVVAENRGSIELEAGRVYDFSLEYFNSGDLGLLRVTWAGPGEPERLLTGE